jgi:hypothetical protein
MSDWLLMTMPLAVVVYFLIYPVQFTFVLNWMEAFLH